MGAAEPSHPNVASMMNNQIGGLQALAGSVANPSDSDLQSPNDTQLLYSILYYS